MKISQVKFYMSGLKINSYMYSCGFYRFDCEYENQFYVFSYDRWKHQDHYELNPQLRLQYLLYIFCDPSFADFKINLDKAKYQIAKNILHSMMSEFLLTPTLVNKSQ